MKPYKKQTRASIGDNSKMTYRKIFRKSLS